MSRDAAAPGGLRRNPRREPFVAVPSRTIRDHRLSFKARGLLSFLLDHPDGWDVRSEVIASDSDKDGITAIRSALHELGAHGYYRLERRRARPGGTFTMGTAISELPVPEWAAEYAEFGGKAVPVMLKEDGSYEVIRKRDTPPPAPDTPPEPAPPGTENLTPETGPAPESGFPTSGDPHPGRPEDGKPGAYKRQNTQTETQTAPVASATAAASDPATPGSDPAPAGSLPGYTEIPSSSKARQPKTGRTAPPTDEHDRLAATLIAEIPEWLASKINAGTRRRLTQGIAAKLRAGWLPADLMSELIEPINPATSHEPVGLLYTRLRDLDDTPPRRLPGARLESWCGACNERTRMREDDPDHPYRCPDCHPALTAERRG